MKISQQLDHRELFEITFLESAPNTDVLGNGCSGHLACYLSIVYNSDLELILTQNLHFHILH